MSDAMGASEAHQPYGEVPRRAAEGNIAALASRLGQAKKGAPKELEALARPR